MSVQVITSTNVIIDFHLKMNIILFPHLPFKIQCLQTIRNIYIKNFVNKLELLLIQRCRVELVVIFSGTAGSSCTLLSWTRFIFHMYIIAGCRVDLVCVCVCVLKLLVFQLTN